MSGAKKLFCITYIYVSCFVAGFSLLFLQEERSVRKEVQKQAVEMGYAEYVIVNDETIGWRWKTNRKEGAMFRLFISQDDMMKACAAFVVWALVCLFFWAMTRAAGDSNE